MTACVNKNHGRRVAGVVTASLVGALTLGGVSLAAVPTVALAEQGSLQSVQPAQTVVTADDGQGNEVSVESGKTVKLEAGAGKYLRVTSLSDSEGNDLELSDYSITYLDGTTKQPLVTLDKKHVTGGDNGNAEAYFNGTYSAGRTDAGKSYYLQVKKGSEDVLTVKFSYETSSLDGVYAYEVNSKDATDTSDTSFTYKGKAFDASTMEFAKKDGTPLTFTSVTFYNADSSTVDNKTSNNYPTAAGSYTAKVTTASGVVNVPVTIEKLDLSKTAVTLGDATTTPTSRADLLNKVKVGGNASTDLVSDLEVTSVKSPNGGATLGGGKGEYEVVVSAKKQDNGQDNANVTGSATVKYAQLDRAVSTFNYGNKPFVSTFAVDLTVGEAFDQSRLKAVDGDESYKGDQLEVSYTDDKTGETVDASALAKPGTYTVSVRVKPFQDGDDKWVGGSSDVEVKVSTTGIVANKGLTFLKDGKVVADNGATPGVRVAYDGTDVLKAITTKVVDDDGKEYAAGTDYTVDVVDKSTNKKVESIVDAGTYELTVNPVTFEKGSTSSASDWKLTVKVDKANLIGAKDYNTGSKTVTTNGVPSTVTTLGSALVWTGSDLDVPAFAYSRLQDDNATPVSPVRYATLDASLYNVQNIKLVSKADGTSVNKTVKTLNEAGKYEVTVALKDAAKKNFNLADRTFEVTVYEAKPFDDVKSTDWFAKGVQRAKDADLVHGISGTRLFAPNADITRADATVILFNMAGGRTAHGDDEFSFDENGGYVTGFSDVDGHAYYAQAIAWAKAAGVATGDAGTTNFRPTDKISRQEFAALLVKYAKSTGKYTAPAEDALSKVSDANTVDGWAKDAVNWAVANKVMGNGGYVAGGSNIIRAEVATMAVNYKSVK